MTRAARTNSGLVLGVLALRFGSGPRSKGTSMQSHGQCHYLHRGRRQAPPRRSQSLRTVLSLKAR